MAYGSQEGHNSQIDFCNRLTDGRRRDEVRREGMETLILLDKWNEQLSQNPFKFIEEVEKFKRIKMGQ